MNLVVILFTHKEYLLFVYKLLIITISKYWAASLDLIFYIKLLIIFFIRFNNVNISKRFLISSYIIHKCYLKPLLFGWAIITCICGIFIPIKFIRLTFNLFFYFPIRNAVLPNKSCYCTPISIIAILLIIHLVLGNYFNNII